MSIIKRIFSRSGARTPSGASSASGAQVKVVAGSGPMPPGKPNASYPSNDPDATPGDMLIWDEYRKLQLAFATKLNDLLAGDPSHQELAIIRAALRDNYMILKGAPEGAHLRPNNDRQLRDDDLPPHGEWDDDDDFRI